MGIMKNHFAVLTRLAAKHQLLLIPFFFGILIPFLAFGKFAEDVWEDGGFERDVPILQFIHHYASPSLEPLMVLTTRLGSALFMLPFAAVVAFILYRKRRDDTLFFTAAVGGVCVINLLAKLFFHRARPTLWLSPVPELDYGFPSGHAMLTMGVVFPLILLAWSTRWRCPSLVGGTLFVLAVGFSRLYLGVHFPSDVMAAWAASLAWVSSAYLFLSPNQPSFRLVQSLIKTVRPAVQEEKGDKRLICRHIA